MIQRDPAVTFVTDDRHGIVAKSGWEQLEARAVLLLLGWAWEERLHGHVPPGDLDPDDAVAHAVLELHWYGWEGARHEQHA